MNLEEILSFAGNATRMCNANGAWTGHTPQCKPIACGDPATFAHASVALLNGDGPPGKWGIGVLAGNLNAAL